MIRRMGTASVNSLRDDARRIAPLIGGEEAFAALDKLLGAMLGTRDEKLVSGRARASDRPAV